MFPLLKTKTQKFDKKGRPLQTMNQTMWKKYRNAEKNIEKDKNETKIFIQHVISVDKNFLHIFE